MVISFVQVVLLIEITYNVNMPANFHNFMSYFNILNLKIFPSMSCVGINYYLKLMLMTMATMTMTPSPVVPATTH